MNKIRVRAAVVLMLMALSFAGAAAWRPTVKLADQRPKVNLETVFPKSFSDWIVDDRMPVQLVSPDTAALLNKIYNETLSRTYVNSAGQRIMLSVAYGGDQSDGTRAHRPEVCYPSQGFELLLNRTGTLHGDAEGMRVRRLIARQGGRVEPITYWMVIGDRVTISGTETKLAQLAYGLRGQVADGVLIRVSSIDSDTNAAFALQQRFIADMARAVPEAARYLVTGQHAL